MNTAGVSLAVTPTVLSTFLSHYFNRRPRRQKPTAQLSYDESLHLVRSFLAHASEHTVEDFQAFTAQWVPHPQWVRVDDETIPAEALDRAAAHLEAQLGPNGIRRVGGAHWWRWRRDGSPLKAEWIEMRADHAYRKKWGDPGNRVMLYVHGGAYFFGSVDEHRYQIQRHARKLQARAFAPRYRLAPQFPFPCGLHDCLAAYLFLLQHCPPDTIILAGDSAGAAMVLSMMVIMRDQGLPLPAGAVLISPWCDLTHSFPSVAGGSPFDFIPPHGFHQKPSMAWPPPNEEELEALKKAAAAEKQTLSSSPSSSADNEPSPGGPDPKRHLSVMIDGKEVQIKEQFQMYTTNELITHPLVSPALQPTLGGLPPLLIVAGGGEILRDEQIYLAHKCANPSRYLPPERWMDDEARAKAERYKPTDVQLQVWDDLCHVATTLSFTKPAKLMYRSIAQFGAWALARAQKTSIEILDDDRISVISSGSSDDDDGGQGSKPKKKVTTQPKLHLPNGSVGKAGDPLPPFKDHMIRQRVTRHGVIYPLAPADKLPACQMKRDEIGTVHADTSAKWLAHRAKWDARYRLTAARVHKKRLGDIKVGYEGWAQGDVPPPTALAGRRKLGHKTDETKLKKKAHSLGLAFWTMMGSRHDEETVERERQFEEDEDAPDSPETRKVNAGGGEGQGARSYADLERQEANVRGRPAGMRSRSRSYSKVVRDEDQTGEGVVAVDGENNNNAAAAEHEALLQTRRMHRAKRNEASGSGENGAIARNNGNANGNGNYVDDEEVAVLSPDPASPGRGDMGMLSPDYDYVLLTNSTGKRPVLGGICMPFTLAREAETASMITLTSALDSVAPPTPSGAGLGVSSSALGTPMLRPLSRASATSTTAVAAAAAEPTVGKTPEMISTMLLPGGSNPGPSSPQVPMVISPSSPPRSLPLLLRPGHAKSVPPAPAAPEQQRSHQEENTTASVASERIHDDMASDRTTSPVLSTPLAAPLASAGGGQGSVGGGAIYDGGRR